MKKVRCPQERRSFEKDKCFVDKRHTTRGMFEDYLPDRFKAVKELKRKKKA